MAETPHGLDCIALGIAPSNPEECRAPLHHSPGYCFPFSLSFLPPSVVSFYFQNQQGNLSLVQQLQQLLEALLQLGGTGPSGRGGPLSEGLSNGTDAESDDRTALRFLPTGLAAGFPSSSSESSKDPAVHFLPDCLGAGTSVSSSSKVAAPVENILEA